MTARKGGFVSGILTVNNGVQHAIFDVEIKRKKVKNTPVGHLYTNDVPPLAIIGNRDKLHVLFQLENASNLNEPSFFIIVEDTLNTNSIDWTELPGEQYAVRTTIGEWQFRRRGTGTWFLTEIQLRIPEANIKKYF